MARHKKTDKPTYNSDFNHTETKETQHKFEDTSHHHQYLPHDESEKGKGIFMGKHEINLNNTTGQTPILTPFQFLYPKDVHHAREVESHKFQKSKLSVQCNTEDNIFTFYNTMQHIASSFNILLKPITDITKDTCIC